MWFVYVMLSLLLLAAVYLVRRWRRDKLFVAELLARGAWTPAGARSGQLLSALDQFKTHDRDLKLLRSFVHRCAPGPGATASELYLIRFRETQYSMNNKQTYQYYWGLLAASEHAQAGARLTKRAEGAAGGVLGAIQDLVVDRHEGYEWAIVYHHTPGALTFAQSAPLKASLAEMETVDMGGGWVMLSCPAKELETFLGEPCVRIARVRSALAA